jgi:ADP-heptose:LPS heptosyltransferase
MNQIVPLKNKLGEPAPARIVILRALQLGDLMCTVPAFRALRAALPNSMITLTGLSWAREFVERFSMYLDHFIEFPGFPGFPEQAADIHSLPNFLTKVQAEHYDLALQMQGSGGISNSLVQLFGASATAGFYLPGQFAPDPDRFLAYPAHENEVNRHLQLMEFLGIPSQGDELEFPLGLRDWEAFQDLQNEFDLTSCNYAVLHPGARSPLRRWPVEWFAAVGEGLVERGLRVVVTGSRDETEIAEAVVAQMKTPALNLAGRTSLGSLGALLSTSRMLVSNDTGVSHVAAALKLSSVVLFTSSDPVRWAPLDNELHRVVDWATTVMPQDVLDEVDYLLKQAVSDENDILIQPSASVEQAV